MEIIGGHNSRTCPLVENQKLCFQTAEKTMRNFMTAHGEPIQVIWAEAGLRISPGKARDSTEIEITSNIPVSLETEVHWKGRGIYLLLFPQRSGPDGSFNTWWDYFRCLRSVLDMGHFWPLSPIGWCLSLWHIARKAYNLFECNLSCYFKISYHALSFIVFSLEEEELELRLFVTKEFYLPVIPRHADADVHTTYHPAGLWGGVCLCSWQSYSKGDYTKPQKTTVPLRLLEYSKWEHFPAY